jgi:hypothetical protein
MTGMAAVAGCQRQRVSSNKRSTTMSRFARSTIGLVALGALSACHTPKAPITGNAAAYTPDARVVDVPWMIALPPVTVLAPTKGIAPSAKAAPIP